MQNYILPSIQKLKISSSFFSITSLVAANDLQTNPHLVYSYKRNIANDLNIILTNRGETRKFWLGGQMQEFFILRGQIQFL